MTWPQEPKPEHCGEAAPRDHDLHRPEIGFLTKHEKATTLDQNAGEPTVQSRRQLVPEEIFALVS